MRELASGVHAGTWLLSPTPQHPAPKWASAEWRLLLLWRLGTPLGLPMACVACGACQDVYGDHALSCTAMGLYKRHITVRDALVTLATAAGLQFLTSIGLRHELGPCRHIPSFLFRRARVSGGCGGGVDASGACPGAPVGAGQAGALKDKVVAWCLVSWGCAQ